MLHIFKPLQISLHEKYTFLNFIKVLLEISYLYLYILNDNQLQTKITKQSV